MRAARYDGKEEIRIEEIAEPELRPGTVKITPAYNGICGSDLHLFHNGPLGLPTADTRTRTRCRTRRCPSCWGSSSRA